MKAILWVPKILIIISLIGVALVAILAFASAFVAATMGSQATQELPEPLIKQPATVLLILSFVYLFISICYSDSVEPLSEGIARISAFVGVSAGVLSFLYFQNHDVLAIIANHDFQDGSRQAIPVFQGLAAIAPWWLLGALVCAGFVGMTNDRSHNIGLAAFLLGGSYLVVKVLMAFL